MPTPGPDRMPRHALASALSGPWMIRPDALRMLRAGLDPKAILRPEPEEDGGDGRHWKPRPLANAPATVKGVAVIPVYGPIFRHANYVDEVMAELFGGTCLSSITDAHRRALADPDVEAILFTFDTPGGMASGVADLAREIRAGATVKATAAYAEMSCCSAGYYLAAACGEVWAGPDAMVGSIGTVFPILDDSEFLAGLGFKDVSVVSSQSPDKWADPADEANGRPLWQATADALGARFVADVAEYRGTTVDEVLAGFGRGWVKVGDDARRAGMVDRVGTTAEALAKLAGPYRNRLAKARPAAATAPQSTTSPAPVRVRLVPKAENAHARPVPR